MKLGKSLRPKEFRFKRGWYIPHKDLPDDFTVIGFYPLQALQEVYTRWIWRKGSNGCYAIFPKQYEATAPLGQWYLIDSFPDYW